VAAKQTNFFAPFLMTFFGTEAVYVPASGAPGSVRL
jgi:hypothetical protein